MTQETKAIMQRFFDEVINSRKLDAVDEITTPDFVDHEQPAGTPSGREGVREFFTMFVAAFPDFKMTIEDMITEGDKGVVRSTLTGTHRGDFMGIPATGKSISVTVIDIIRLSGGKVAEHWGVTDTATMMEQLGLAAPGG